jgi:hypothetical protein
VIACTPARLALSQPLSAWSNGLKGCDIARRTRLRTGQQKKRLCNYFSHIVAGKLEWRLALGVLVVPVGELERFVQDVPGHGPAWVTAVLENNLHKSPGPEATDFVTKLRTAARAAANA